jgi:hypothetical protein
LYIRPQTALDGVFEIGIFEHDERIAAAELHRRRFEVLTGARRDAPAGCHAARQCHAFDTGIIDQIFRLIVRNQKIGVEPSRRARVRQKLLKGNRALRHTSGVLDQ